MKFYHTTWFIFVLVLCAGGLFASVLFLANTFTELEYLNATAGNNFVERYVDEGLPIGFTEGGVRRGNPNAKVRIVEFSDFECPFCREAFFILQDVWTRHEDDIYFEYRHFPIISLHPNAERGAIASMCAEEHNAFWPYHDLLFQNQEDLSDRSLKNFAIILDLDTETFNRCLSSGKYTRKIEQDVRDGLTLGVNATPTFFIEGRKIEGVLPLEIWEQLIKELQ